MLPLFYIERIKRKLSDKEQQKNIIKLRSAARSLSTPIQNPIIIEDQEVEEQELIILYPDLVKKYGPPVPERSIAALKRRMAASGDNHYFFKNMNNEVRDINIRNGLLVFAEPIDGSIPSKWGTKIFYAYTLSNYYSKSFNIIGITYDIKSPSADHPYTRWPLEKGFDTAQEAIDYGKFHRNNLIEVNRLRAAGAM